MAQSATNDLTLRTAHDRLRIKVTEVDRLFQQHAMVGCLDNNARKTEAGELRRKLWQKLGYLEARIDMTVFMRARGTRLKTEHDNRGKSITDHPTEVAVALMEPGSATNAKMD